MKRLLLVFLALCMLLMPFAALAQGYVRFELNTGGVDAWLQTGLGEDGLPRLFGGYDGVDVGIVQKGALINYNGLTMGASFKTIAQTLLMQLLDLKKAPDFTAQDTSVLLLAVNRYIDGLPEDALSIGETTLADGRTCIEVRIHPKKLCEYTDETVRSLLSDGDPQMTAFFRRQQEIISRLVGLPDSAENVQEQLLVRWEQLQMGELLDQEYPVSLALTGGDDGAWNLEASFLGCEFSAMAVQGRVKGHLMVEGIRYSFDSEDLLYILKTAGDAAQQAFRGSVYFSDERGDDRRTIRLEYSISGFVASFFNALQRTVVGGSDRLDGILERLSPWLVLVGIDAKGLDAYQLFARLGDLQQDVLRTLEQGIGYLCNRGRFSLSTSLQDVLPLQLEVSLFGYMLYVNADRQMIDASMKYNNDVLTLRGMFGETESVIVLTQDSYGSRCKQYILSVQHENDTMSFQLKNQQNETLLTGEMDAQCLRFRAEQLDGLVTWNDDALHAQILCPEWNDIVTADFWRDGDTHRLEIKANNRLLRAEVDPDGFSLQTDSLSFYCRLMERNGLQMGWQSGLGRYANTVELNVMEDSISFSAANRYNRLELQVDSNGIMVAYTGLYENIRVVVTKKDGSTEKQSQFRIFIEADAQLYYDGLLTVTKLMQGLELRLTSEIHEPYMLNISWSDEPMVFEGEESCTWLEPEMLNQFVELFPKIQ